MSTLCKLGNFSCFCCHLLILFILVLFDLILYVPSTIFQLYRDESSWVEPVLSYTRIKVSCSRTQLSDAGEAWTPSPSVSSRQALYHWATALPVYFGLNLFYLYKYTKQHILNKITIQPLYKWDSEESQMTIWMCIPRYCLFWCFTYQLTILSHARKISPHLKERNDNSAYATWFCMLFKLTLILPIEFCPENIVCFLRLLHIYSNAL